ncbi:MAG: sigma-70 family RNA polymerase sigma factor [Planctomycetota bacterium]
MGRPGGDPQAFGELVERHQSRVWRVARGLVGSDEDAQDIAQEAFLRVYRGLEGFDPQFAFSTWLYRIVTNLCIDHLRKKRRHTSLSAGADDLDDGPLMTDLPDPREEGPADGLMALETAGEVRTVLEGLAPHFRTALVLRELEGLSCKEIADIVGVTHVTVRWRLHRGRKLFLDAWNRHHNNEQHPGEGLEEGSDDELV